MCAIVHARKRKRKNNAILRMKFSPGLKQQGQLHFASPFFLLFPPSLPVSQRVSTAESTHLDPLFFSAGEGGGSHRRVDAIFILHQQRKKFLVRAPNLFFFFFFACHPKPLGTEFNHICCTFWHHLMICLHHRPSWIWLTCGHVGELF